MKLYKNIMRNRKGSTTIEAALIIPVIFFISFICIWFLINFTVILMKQFKDDYSETSMYEVSNPTDIHRLIIVGSDTVEEILNNGGGEEKFEE